MNLPREPALHLVSHHRLCPWPLPSRASCQHAIPGVLVSFAIGLAVSAAQGPPKESAPLEPTLNGSYFRMICDHGCMYRTPIDQTFRSYAEMRKVGCDGAYNYQFLTARRSSLSRMCEPQGMSVEDYLARVAQLHQTHGLSFWATYHVGLPGVQDTTPESRQKLVRHFRESVRPLTELPHFRGVAYDEPWAWDNCPAENLVGFKRHLLAKYSSEQLRGLGLGVLTRTDAELLCPPIVLEVAKHAALSEEYNQFLSKKLMGQGLTADPPAETPARESPAEVFRRWMLKKHSRARLKELELGALARPDTTLVLPEDAAKEKTPTQDEEADDDADPVDTMVEPKREPVRQPMPENVLVLPAKYGDNPVLFMEYEEFVGSRFESLLAEYEHTLRELKPDAVTFPVLSFMTILHKPLRSSVARLGRTCGAISVDFYADGAQEEGFWAKLMRNQARGPSFLTITAGKYGSGPQRFARDLALCSVHSPAVNIWCWLYAWKDTPTYDPGAAAYHRQGNYEAMARIFERVSKAREYLAPSGSTAKIALVYSERESMWDQAGEVAWPRRVGGYCNYAGFVGHCYNLHCAFGQLGVQYEPIFEQFISPEELKPYSVLILPAVGYLRPTSVAAIKDWVRRGGALVVTGNVGHRDRWGRVAEASVIRDLLGAVAERHEHAGAFSLSPDGSRNLEVRYDVTLPAVRYVCNTAKAIGRWQDGSVAAAVNEVGAGKVIFVGAEELACSYVGWGGVARRFAVGKAFFPGVTECLDRVLRMALGDAAEELPLQNISVPRAVEVTVRRQPARYIVHLINFRPQAAPIEDARVAIRIPEGARPVVFYPEDMSRVQHRAEGRDVVVTVRAFDVHEVFVVQYDGESPKLGEARPGRFVFPRETYIRDQSRGVAYIGKYPGAATAREMRMPLREHPLPFLHTPIDYPKFSQDHCLIAVSPSTIAKKHVQHLADYVRQGGLVHLFSGAGAYEDINGNYREDDGQYSNVRSSLFEQVTGPVLNRRPKHRYTYINRVRFTRKHPIFEGLPVGQWIDLQPAEAGQEKQWWYRSQRFDVPRGAKDALVEAEVWSYNTALTIPGERQGVYPIVLLRGVGKGYVLWDTVNRDHAITCSGSLSPVFNKLAENVLKWAASR